MFSGQLLLDEGLGLRACRDCRVCYYVEGGFYVSNPNSCRECLKARAKARRWERIDEVRAYDRLRQQDPSRQEQDKLRSRRRRQDPEQRIKIDARNALNAAVDAGLLVRPTACEVCGVQCRPHGHHDDYTKQLEVRWVCVPCHTVIHHGEPMTDDDDRDQQAQPAQRDPT